MPQQRVPARVPDRIVDQLETVQVEIQQRHHGSRAPRLQDRLAEPLLEQQPGNQSEFACPACGGVLNEVHDGKLLRFRCRNGHAYGPASLGAEQQLALEGALWAALRALEEQATLNRRLATRARDRGHLRSAARFDELSVDSEDQARILREVLSRGVLPALPEEVPQRDPA